VNESEVTSAFDLVGTVSVVTGGGSGIGLGIAAGLARAGSSIALIARSAERLAQASTTLSRFGTRVIAISADVSDETAMRDAMALVREELGRIDACFASAGTGGDVSPLVDTSLESFRSVTRVNLDGVFLTFREAARHMIETGGGSLVAISSLGARQGMPRQYGYAASKAAIIALVNSAAVELAHRGIRANAIQPGWISTEMVDQLITDAGFQQRVIPRIPLRRWGLPEDLAGATVYLASSASAYHTGDVLLVDGGYGRF
jgi:NAD(P)-dependent dehydrogenase (short-subunit alcohol dehydrogenase family)